MNVTPSPPYGEKLGWTGHDFVGASPLKAVGQEVEGLQADNGRVIATSIDRRRFAVHPDEAAQ